MVYFCDVYEKRDHFWMRYIDANEIGLNLLNIIMHADIPNRYIVRLDKNFG